MNRLMGKIRELSRTNPSKCQRTVAEIEQIWAGVMTLAWFTPVFEALLPVEIEQYDRELPSIVMETNQVKKAEQINHTLGGLMKSIEKELPFLESTLQESLRRIDTLTAKS
ncbi:hypothetical protein D3C73_1351210 [compost metagenome]